MISNNYTLTCRSAPTHGCLIISFQVAGFQHRILQFDRSPNGGFPLMLNGKTTVHNRPHCSR